MSQIFFLLALSVISFLSIAQNEKEALVDEPKENIIKHHSNEFLQASSSSMPDSTIHKFVDQMPEFPGGEFALYNFISKNIQYPDSALKNEKERTVRVLYIVEKDGSLSNVVVKRPVGYGFDEEAIRLVKSMPKWKPGKTMRKPVRVYYQIPVKFVLK